MSEPQTNTMIDLTGAWEFQLHQAHPDETMVPEDLLGDDAWLPATVPGAVHTDLMACGKLEDPFYRDNETRVGWVAEVDWLYRKRFEISEEFLEAQAVHLMAEGLDTLATIFINDVEVARTENMHVAHRFEVSRYLKPGTNELRIHFESPLRRARALEARFNVPNFAHAPHRRHLRKAQYSFGWDWGPELPTSGIWRPIYLQAAGSVRLADVAVSTDFDPDFSKAQLSVQVDLERFEGEAREVVCRVEIAGVSNEVSAKGDRVTVPVTLEQPRLWWPNGLGEPHLYDLNVRLLREGVVEDARTLQLGLRKLELVQEADAQGESFFFKINDIPVYCKGANWIPADSFLPRVSAERYRALLEAARDADMNMIRVWGGGIYEEELFYDLCDELGLLVWQDFMFACANYPDDEAFTELVRAEVVHVVRRLRHRACLAIWCGNNENEWIWYRSMGRSWREMPGLSLFHEVIPEICQRLDPARPYWPSSPFGGDDPNDPAVGNRHQWDIWSRWEDFTIVKDDRSRFVTEFGFQGPANASTFAAVTRPEDRWPQSEVMEFHNKQVEGPERIYRFLAGHVGMPADYEDYLYKAQVVQGETLAHCLHHWRRQKFHTAGSIIWQLNDCWPVTSWALIDSALRPKAAYYYVKRAFAPVLLTLVEADGRIVVHLVNDTLRPVRGRLRITERSFDGDTRLLDELMVSVGSNGADRVHELSLAVQDVGDPSTHYLHAELLIEHDRLCEARFYFKRFKHLRLPEASFEKQMQATGDGAYALTLRASHFAKAVRLTGPGDAAFDDNYFDLDAGEVRTVSVRVPAGEKLDAGGIEVRALRNVLDG